MAAGSVVVGEVIDRLVAPRWDDVALDGQGEGGEVLVADEREAGAEAELHVWEAAPHGAGG